MMARRTGVFLLVLLLSATPRAQTPTAVETTKIGPQVGTTAPPIAGVDQFGKPRTLANVAGRNGVMLVFFRSADW